jgi:hypothetical protein
MATNDIHFDATQNPVEAVTVFQSNRADIRRVLRLDLKVGSPVQRLISHNLATYCFRKIQTGQNHITVEKLPNCLLGDSIRAEGCAHATIFDVIYKPPAYIYRSDGPEITKLYEERNVLAAKITRSNTQSKVLTTYSESLTAGSATPDSLHEFLRIYEAAESKLFDERAETNQKILALDSRIQALRNAANIGDASKNRRAQITVVVFADRDGQAQINLSYGTCSRSHVFSRILNRMGSQS